MNIKENTEDFYSISQGGLLHRALKKVHFEKHFGRIAILMLCFTWLPLLIITVIEGKLYTGTNLPFLYDVAIQGRILVGIPLMILIRNIIYRKIPPVLQYVSEVLVFPKDREHFINGALQKAQKRIDSAWTEIILLLLVAVVAVSPAGGTSFFADHSKAGSWVMAGDEGLQALSYAGKWMHYISIPVFQFLLLRWLWRYLVWVALLYRISRLKLNLLPTHPDGSGGLSIILLGQQGFILLFAVFGMVISGEMIANLFENDKLFDIIKVQIAGFVILGSILMLFPLFFFTGKLFRTKYHGLIDLGKAGMRLSNKYEDEFVKLMRTEKRIAENTVDPSMQVDYSDVYKSLQEMRTLPIRFSDIVIMALMLFVPFIPIFFIHYSIVELLQKIMGLLV